MTAAAAAALVTVALSVIGAIVMLLMVNYLPDSPLQAYMAQSSTFWSFCAGLGWFIPIDRILTVFSAWVVVMFSIVVYKVVYELISKVLLSS